jgi:hypothetical protein
LQRGEQRRIFVRLDGARVAQDVVALDARDHGGPALA